MSATKPGLHKPRRTQLTSVNEDGSRYVIHPSDTKGPFTNARRIVAIALIVVYALLPWIKIGGYPAVFLDTNAMRFHFFGLTFVSHDIWLGFFLITGLVFGLFYVTSLFGRVWCGWACPQTVFLEHVYRRVERWLEGDAPQRRRLDEAPWNIQKILRRGLKHTLFLLISAAIAHLFMAYFVSIPALWSMMGSNPGENWGVFLFVFIYTVLLYFNYAWFREQLCIIICPYGRLQSVLIDDHSVVIGYDELRGEPRGKLHEEEAGDCIDCNRCVQVCPTGIDIRQGLQMECVGCSNCIDACDAIMDKVNRPRGLIRYDSMQGLEGRKTKWIRPRTIAYSILLLIGIAVLTFSISGLSTASLTAWRLSGPPYHVDETYIRNQYMLRVTNRNNEPAYFSLSMTNASPGAVINGIDEKILIDGNGDALKALIVLVPKSSYQGESSMQLNVLNEAGKTVAHRELEFIGPDPKLIHPNG
jgi:cytochrome c oxidase accessory protein FixG